MMKDVIRGSMKGKMLRPLIPDYSGRREYLALWRSYFATLHVEEVESGRPPQLGVSADDTYRVGRTTLYKVLITCRSGGKTYIGSELREETPEATEAAAGVPP